MNLSEFVEMSRAVLALLPPDAGADHRTAIVERLLRTNRIVMPSEVAAHREHVAQQAQVLDTMRLSAMASATPNRSDF
jgi:hypothetical protein